MKVLIVDDDPGTQEIFRVGLKNAGFEVCQSISGRKAIEIACIETPEFALVDLQLPDITGLEVLRQFNLSHLSTIPVVITGFGTTRTAVDALRLGAYDYLEKPIDIDELVQLLLLATGASVSARNARLFSKHFSHALSRWALIVVSVLDAPTDPNTLAKWARLVGVSVGAIRNWCHTAGVSGKKSLNFARLLRAVVRQAPQSRPQDLLDVVDLRTLDSLFRLGTNGASAKAEFPRDVDAFLAAQRWIVSEPAIDEVRKALRARGAGAFQAHALR